MCTSTHQLERRVAIRLAGEGSRNGDSWTLRCTQTKKPIGHNAPYPHGHGPLRPGGRTSYRHEHHQPRHSQHTYMACSPTDCTGTRIDGTLHYTPQAAPPHGIHRKSGSHQKTSHRNPCDEACNWTPTPPPNARRNTPRCTQGSVRAKQERDTARPCGR